MKYDASYVGKKVLKPSGEEGVITAISPSGGISTRFQGDLFGGEYMFDPFLSGHLKFADEALQAAVDAEIAQLRQDKMDRVQKYIVSKGGKARFCVTLDCPDGSVEAVYYLNCNEEQAYEAFSLAVDEQARSYRASGFSQKWRVVRLFDAKTNELLCQES